MAQPHGGYPQAGFTDGGYPQGGYPPPGGFPQGGYPPPGGFPTTGGFPQGGHPPTGGFPQGGYPPPGDFPQGGYYPPGGYPPTGGLAQGGYPPPGVPGSPQVPNSLPAGVTKDSGVTPGSYPPPQPGFAGAGFGEPADQYAGPDGSFGEDVDVKGFDFTEKSIRRGFIRKVYAILMTQLAVTLSVITLFTYHWPTRFWVVQHPETLWAALIAIIVCLVAMACCDGVRRKAPMNLVFLGVFTAAESFMLGVVTTQYEGQEVMMAVGITAAICLALTLFAMQTRFDFTALGGVLLCVLVVFVLFGIIAIFIPKNTILSLVYASIGALLFSFYLIYDTQLMMGGKHKYAISPEEYVFAALNLYLDVINIFLYILRIIGAARG